MRNANNSWNRLLLMITSEGQFSGRLSADTREEKLMECVRGFICKYK